MINQMGIFRTGCLIQHCSGCYRTRGLSAQRAQLSHGRKRWDFQQCAEARCTLDDCRFTIGYGIVMISYNTIYLIVSDTIPYNWWYNSISIVCRFTHIYHQYLIHFCYSWWFHEEIFEPFPLGRGETTSRRAAHVANTWFARNPFAAKVAAVGKRYLQKIYLIVIVCNSKNAKTRSLSNISRVYNSCNSCTRHSWSFLEILILFHTYITVGSSTMLDFPRSFPWKTSCRSGTFQPAPFDSARGNHHWSPLIVIMLHHRSLVKWLVIILIMILVISLIIINHY